MIPRPKPRTAAMILAALCALTSGCGTTRTYTDGPKKDSTIPVVKEEDVMPVKDTSEGVAYKFKVMGIEKQGDFQNEPAVQRTHTVVKGETLYSIARSYRVTLEELTGINGIEDPSRILVGQELIIPDR